MLQWADEQGCPWDAYDVIQAADEKGHGEIVQWVEEEFSKSRSLMRWCPVVPSSGAWGWGAVLLAVLVVILALIGAAAKTAGIV
jgi:hypothetical protein